MTRFAPPLLALLLLPALSACDLFGGDDDGNNNDPDRAVITSITIEAIPSRMPDGDTWDDDPLGITSDPDLYFDLLDSAGSLVYTTEESDEANVAQDELPVSWQPSPGITFNRFDRTLYLEVYDKDPQGEDFIAETESFVLQDLADQDFRTFVSLESDDGDTVVTLRLRWED